MPQKLTAEIINAAIEGFEPQRRHIVAQIDELRPLLKGDGTAPTAQQATKPRADAAGISKRDQPLGIKILFGAKTIWTTVIYH